MDLEVIALTTGEKVRILRQNKGWTQEQLALKIGRGKSFISHIENNRDKPVELIVDIAKALDTTPSFLMGWERDPEQKRYLNHYVDELTDEQFARLLIFFKNLIAENDK